MSRIRKWTVATSRLLVLIAIPAAVAVLVAYNVEPADPEDDIPLVVPQITANQRQTTMLQEVNVQPVLSGDGTVVELDGDDGFALQATISPADQAYRLLQDPVGVKALIVGGPAGFECSWDGLVNTPSGLMMQCRVPDDIEVVAGLQGTMVLQLDAPSTVMGLPVSAVVGTNQQGEVIVLRADGTTEVRTVELGVSDAFNIEIIDGLDEGETVYLNPVQSEFSAGRP